MAVPADALPAAGAAGDRAARRALLAGNFAIGCGVMAAAGSLNDLVASLRVSVSVGGQLITAAAVAMALGAPLLAAAVSGWDRRRLLALALVWYAVGHAASALMPDYAWLLPVRAATVLAAAVFTPQAAAAIAVMAAPSDRGRAMTTIFLGWSLASVLGMPLASFIAETAGWRYTFGAIALLSAAAAWSVWHALPDGIRPPSLSAADWRRTLTHPLLMGMVGVTALSAAGQFSLFSYFAPYYRQVLGASPGQVSTLFLWFGAMGLVGNLLLQRVIDRQGAARCVTATLIGIAVSLAAWPLAGGVLGVALVLVPWALGCFASNSAQQVRLSAAAPALAPALMALNSSAMYLGQALGAASGGAIIAAGGFRPLPGIALAWIAGAIVLSAVLMRAMRGRAHV